MTHDYGKKFGEYEQVIADSGAMLFDQGLCIGCRACQVACKRWNDREPSDSKQVSKERHLAEGQKVGFGVAESLTNPTQLEAETWLFMRFNEFGEAGNADSIKWLFTRVSCMHCAEAPCVSGCPTTALWKHPEGPVEVRTDLCIGCRNCIETCPFDVPRINEKLGVVEKCTLCADRIANEAPVVTAYKGIDKGEPQFDIKKGSELTWKGRLEPACVEACPTDALKWGDRKDMVALAQKRAQQMGGFTYGIEEAGGTNVLYVLEKPPEELGLPKVFKERMSTRENGYLAKVSGVGIAFAIAGIALAGLNWVKRRKEVLSKSMKGG